MFAKDFDTLNEIYDKKILKENLGLGPLADNEGVTPSPSKIQKIAMPPKRDCVQDRSEDCEGYTDENSDNNSTMSRQLLFRIFKLSAMLHNLLKNKGNVEAWVLSKITNAHDQLDSVFGYEDYESARQEMELMGVEENNEEELFSAISKGGDDLVKQLKTVLRRESKEVLEKVLLETINILEAKNS